MVPAHGRAPLAYGVHRFGTSRSRQSVGRVGEWLGTALRVSGSAPSRRGRRRLVGGLVASVAVLGMVPWGEVSVSAGVRPQPADGGPTPTAASCCSSPPTASTQDTLEEFAERARQHRARLPRARPQGCHRQGQRPPDAGAAEHRRRLVHADHRRLAGHGRVDEQHVPHQRPAVRQPHVSVRRRCAAGRDAGPVRRARRSEGRPDRVGRRARRLDRRADRRLPQLPVGPRRGHQLHRRDDDNRRPTTRVHGQLRPAVRPSRRLRRPAALPGRRPDAGDRLDRRARVLQPARRRCACGCSTAGIDKYGLNAYLYDSTDDGDGRTTTACCSRPRRTATTWSATSPRASGPTSR